MIKEKNKIDKSLSSKHIIRKKRDQIIDAVQTLDWLLPGKSYPHYKKAEARSLQTLQRHGCLEKNNNERLQSTDITSTLASDDVIIMICILQNWSKVAYRKKL